MAVIKQNRSGTLTTILDTSKILTTDTTQTGISGAKTFTTSPNVPTATAGDSSTKSASTAFVMNAVAGFMNSFEDVYTASAAVASGTQITLPGGLSYKVGTHMLQVSYNGTVCYLNNQYEEVGNQGATSTKIKILFPLSAGDELQFRITGIANTTTISDAVRKTGAENIDGVKTFTSLPVVPTTAPTSNGQVISKKYADDNLVHKTGDETVQGIKVFQNGYDDFPDDGTVENTLSGIHIRHTSDYVKGQSVSATHFAGIFINDGSGSIYEHVGRTASIQDTITASSGHYISFNKFKNVVHSSGTGITPSSETAQIALGFDGNDIPFSIAVSTPLPADRNNNRDILTRDWIPKDTRIVHSTGDENIAGKKRFTGSFVGIKFEGIAVGGTNSGNKAYSFETNTNTPLGSYGFTQSSTDHYLDMTAYANTTENPAYSIALSYDYASFNSAGVSNKITLGRSGRLWKQLFAGTATINTSDERLKSNIESIPDSILDCWENVNWIQYQFNDALEEKHDKARIHTGLIAQQIDRVFKSDNLDISKYGLFCYDEWPAEEAVYNDDGTEKHPASPAGNQYSIRYEEALCIEAAYQRRRADRLEARVKELEEQMELVLSKIK